MFFNKNKDCNRNFNNTLINLTKQLTVTNKWSRVTSPGNNISEFESKLYCF